MNRFDAKLNRQPVIDLNIKDLEESTALLISLKNNQVDISLYFLRNYLDLLDIKLKSKK
jgi:hypothetical protein